MLRVLRKMASIYAGGFVPVRGAPVDRLGHAAVFWRLCTRKEKRTLFLTVSFFETIRAAGLAFPAAVSLRSRYPPWIPRAC